MLDDLPQADQKKAHHAGWWEMKGIVLIALSALGVLGATNAAEFSFGRPFHLTLARENAASVAIGDVNGDGRMDLAVTEDSSPLVHHLSLYIQRSDGVLAAPVRMALPDDEWGWAFPVTIADLDHDGAGEIMVGTSELLVVRFTGGALTTIASRPARYGCFYLASGDVDADGKMDVVCHSGLGTPTSATVFYGAGTGVFRATTDLQTGAGSYGSAPDFMSIQLADATGDGRPDLLVTASRAGSFFVYANNGVGGFFSTGAAYTHPWSATGVWPSAIQVLDLDGDGANEVVTASPDNRPDAALNIYRRGPNGYLALTQRLPIHDSTTALLAADLDGNGDQELLAGHYAFNAVTVLGAGSAGVGSQVRFDLPGFGNAVELARLIGHAKSLALGDLNGDGCVDLAGATYSGVTLLHGCRPFRNHVPVSDFDGDGVGDLLWRNEGTKEFYLWQWADIGAWMECARPCPTYKVPPWTVQATGDFDGDGNSDTIWRNGQSGQNAILLSAFYERAITGVTNQNWRIAAAGDFDGDDRSDLLWRNVSTGANTIWKSANSLTQQLTRAVTDLGWRIVGVGDFNGDRRSDILWRHSISGGNVIWLSGRPDTQKAMVGVTNVQWKVVGVGDFNGDGADDVVWRNASTGANTIWLSANSRTQKGLTGVTNLAWDVVAVADYNGDETSDLMWRNGMSGENTIWLAANPQWRKVVSSFGPTITVVR